MPLRVKIFHGLLLALFEAPEKRSCWRQKSRAGGDRCRCPLLLTGLSVRELFALLLFLQVGFQVGQHVKVAQRGFLQLVVDFLDGLNVHSLYLNNCTKLITADLSATTVTYGGFYGCSNLTELILPDQFSIANEDGYGGLSGCTSLRTIRMPIYPSGIASFSGTPVESVKLPSGTYGRRRDPPVGILHKPRSGARKPWHQHQGRSDNGI